MVNGLYSEQKEVIFGLPQGSILDPILFLLYINDLPDTVEYVSDLLADYTIFFYIYNDDGDNETLQRHMKNLDTRAISGYWKFRDID